MIEGKGQTKQRLYQFEESIQDNGTKLPMNNSRFYTSFKKDVTASAHVSGTILGNGEARHDILNLPSCKQVKRKLVIPTSTFDQFLKDQGIHKDDETKRDNKTTSDVEFMLLLLMNITKDWMIVWNKKRKLTLIVVQKVCFKPCKI